jgi:cystathionine beta-lyase
MKKYNLEETVKRYNTGSGKWNTIAVHMPEAGDDVIPFSVADIEFMTAPEIVKGLQDYLETHILGYANPTDDYKQSVIDWMKNRHDWEPKKEWMLSSHGIVDAFYEAVKAYAKEWEGVMLLTPVYYPMYSAINVNKRVLVDCPLVRTGSRYEIDFDDFEKKAKDPNTKLFILCSPHNPCSRVWTREELERMGRICLENDVFVVSDEIHFDLIMPGYKHIVFSSISDEFAQNSMVCTAPSKTFNLAGLQTSNIFIANEERRKQFMDSQMTSTTKMKCNILGYQACKLAYENCEEWLNQVIDVVAENKRIIEEFFAKEFPQIQIMDFEATYLLWMDWNGLGLDYKELERINREEAGLFFDEGYVFAEQGRGFERWNLACPTKYIVSALERMKKAYAPYVK